MPDRRKLKPWTTRSNIEIDLAPPPVVADCQHHILDTMLAANTLYVRNGAQYRARPYPGTECLSVVKEADDLVLSASLYGVNENGSMA